MCPRPRAHWICRAAISTRRSSATDWLGRRSGGHREGTRLGQRDGRGGPAAQEAAGGRPDTRTTERRQTDRPQAGRGARRRMEQRWGRHLGESGAGGARRHWDRPGRLALLARLWSAADLLPPGRDNRDRSGVVGQRFVLEATPRLRPRGLADPHRLGDSPHDAGSIAARRRQGGSLVALPRRAAAALTPVTRHLTPLMPENFKNFIAGEWVAPRTGAYFENRNPADWDDVIGCFPRSGPDDVTRAIASAKRGFATWSRTPAPIRGQVLQRVGELLVARKEAIAKAMTREMGKVLAESRGDVQEGIDTAFYAASEGRRLFGRVVPSELRNKWAMAYRRPIGIAGLITPFNFPMAIPTWKMFPALACGNAVIFKPAEDVPHTAHLLVEILVEAGLPPEALQLVHGEGSVVGRAIVEHPDVSVISFTGSTETGAVIGATCGKLHKRLSLEMGGKNAMIVMDDADLDLALDGVLWGAFGTTGQRCTATSRLILHEQIHDQFLRSVCDRAEPEPLGPIAHAPQELVVDLLVEDEPARRRAALSGRAERPPQHAVQRQVQVGIVHHDHRVLAAHFERQALVELAAGGSDHRARLGRAGERNDRDVRVLNDRPSHNRPLAVHQLERLWRQPRFHQDFHQQMGRVRHVLGGLEDHGVPAGERGKHLPRRDRHREIEGGDEPGDADRSPVGHRPFVAQLGGHDATEQASPLARRVEGRVDQIGRA